MAAINWSKSTTFYDNKSSEIAKDVQGDGWVSFLDALGVMENNGSYDGRSNALYAGIYQVGNDQLDYMNFLNGIGHKVLGVNSKEEFSKDPISQELAGIMEFSGIPDIGTSFASKYYTVKLGANADANANWNLLLDHTFKINYTNAQGIVGSETITLTKAGISAAAHLVGQGTMANAINRIFASCFAKDDGTGEYVQISNEANFSISGNYADGNGVAFSTYVKLLQNYNIDALLSTSDKSGGSITQFADLASELMEFRKDDIVNNLTTTGADHETAFTNSTEYKQVIHNVLRGLDLPYNDLDNVSPLSKVVLVGGQTINKNYSNYSDLIIGVGESNNLLRAGEGDDYLYGGKGNDVILGEDGNDFLYGGDGNDSLDGGNGADHLYGGDGITSVDTLDGGEGNDILEGGEGVDIYKFTGNFGHDIIKDSDSNGVLQIDGASLTFTQTVKDGIIYKNDNYTAVKINEGDTTSLIITSTDKTKSITIKNFSEGTFGITLNQPETVAADTNVFTANDANHKNSLTFANAFDIDPNAGLSNYTAINATGTDSADLLMGLNLGKDTLIGGDGNDVISSGFTGVSDFQLLYAHVTDKPGADSIDGGKGDDYIVASTGTVAHGGDDNDVLDASKILFLVTGASSAGRDKIWQDLQQIIDIKPTVKITPPLQEVTLVTGLKFNKNLTSTYTEFPSVVPNKRFIAKYENNKVWVAYIDPITVIDNNVIYDNVGVWQFGEVNIVPSNGHTYEEIANQPGANLFGDKGDDYVFGGNRADYLSGGDGKDTIIGGEGNDVIDGGKENDSIAGSEGNDLIIGGEGNDLIWGSDGDPRVGASDDDTIYGGSGNDTLHGDGGSDYLDGGSGADILYGGEGNDYLYGGDDGDIDMVYGEGGDDTLVLGDNDQVDLGSGNNIYIWKAHAYTNQTFPTASASAFPSNSVTSSNSFSNVLGDAFGDATSTNSTNSSSKITYIKNSEGNNTLGISGLSSLKDADIDISGNYLLITTANHQQLAIQDGVSNRPVQIVFGNSAEQLIDTPVVFTPLTDDHFLNGIAPLDQAQVTSADLMLAKVGTPVVLGGGANQYLVGGLKNDTLTANVAGSTLIGGEGNDSLLGDVADDTYLIRKDDGNDIITEKGGHNHIKFDKNIAISDVVVRRNGADLIFTISEDQHITIKNMFDAQTGALSIPASTLDVTFYNNTVWNLGQIKQQALTSTVADDSIAGFDGDDTYYYSLGNGRDVITDGLGNDTIQLGAGIAQAQVIVRKDINNLILSFNDGGSITVTNAFDTQGNFTSNAIESVKFSDNSSWNLAQLKTEVLKDQARVLTGTDGNDVLIGDAGKDLIIGRKGNDQLLGGDANDTYQYSLGDGNDVITDTNGLDAIQFTSGILPSDVIARSNGKDLTLTLADGGVLTVKDMFVSKTPNSVDPLITTIINQLNNRWISQAEILIESNFGLKGSGNLELNFGHNITGGQVANVSFKVSQDGQYLIPVLTVDLDDFAELPNGTAPYYYDRIITHEMTHAVMASNMNIAALPGWFLEGTAEFIQGADERVKIDWDLINNQSNFEALFKTTAGSPETAPGYTVGYIGVKFLDNEIRVAGGTGIREVFDQLKSGKTLNQALAAVSLAHGGMGGAWSDLGSFESHFKATGLSSLNSLLDLNDKDTGSIAGSDYGGPSLDAKSVVPDVNSGTPKYFNLVIPPEFIPVGNEHNEIESIQFSNGDSWDITKIQQEVKKGNLIATNWNDVIVGTSGMDTIRGLKGDDQLLGGEDNDIYQYALGDGHDVISDTSGANQIFLDAGILPDKVKVSRSTSNLVLTFSDGGSITISDAFDFYGSLNSSIPLIKFAEGYSWNYLRVHDELRRSTGSTLTAPEKGLLLGGNGDDILIAGKNNNLYGGIGNDTYLINSGGEQYIIADNSGGNTLQFGPGITKEQISFSRDWVGTSLHVMLNGRDYVLVQNMFQGVYTTGQDANNYSNPAIEFVKFDNGDQFTLNDIKKRLLQSTDGNDVLYGFEANDVLNGGAGNDNIMGFEGDDTLIGGAGNDGLNGGYGNDTYVYNLNDGFDRIGNMVDGNRGYSDGFDILKFGTGISKEQITFTRYANGDVELHTDDNNSVTLLRMFVNSSNDIPLPPINQIQFVNGDIWTVQDIKDKVISATNGNDEIYGFETNDKLLGLSGDDYLNAFAGDDTLQGGVGNDYLEGGDGNDVYVFGLGDGQDYIDDHLGNNIIELGAGISPSDIIFSKGNRTADNSQNGNELILSLNTGDSIAIKGIFYYNQLIPNSIKQTIKFVDGTIWNPAKIQDFANAILNDTTPPSTPTATFDLDGRVITGTAEANNVITVTNSSDAVIGIAKANGSGNYSITLTTALINKEIVNVTAKDASGNVSTAKALSAPDKTPPLAPWGNFDSSGKVITGTTEAGGKVEVKSSTDIVSLGTAVADTDGHYSITLTTTYINRELFYLTATDTSGNVSSSTTIAAPDYTPPVQPTASFDTTGKIINGIAEPGSYVQARYADSQRGITTADSITGAYEIILDIAFVNNQVVDVNSIDPAGNVSPFKTINAPDKTAPSQPSAAFNTAGKVITGVAEAGSTVEVKNSGNTITLGSATANATTGAYTITLTTALINKETVNVTAKDAAGNVSTARAIIAPDKTAPSQPTAAFDTAGKVITGIAEAGSTVEVKNSGNTTTLGTATANATTGAYSITLTTALINSETVNVTAKDTAGNVSVVKAIVAPDKTAPSQPTAAFDTAGKIITGVAEAGSTVEVKNSGNTTTLGTATANATTGAYSITLTTALINKETVNVTAKDAAGNVSTVKAITAPLVDVTPPAQPTAAFDTTGKVITGVAEAGSTVEIKNSGNTTTLGTATANASTGAYSITLTTALINSETVNVTAKDAAGNVSIVKAIVAPDKTAPSQPTAAFDTAGKVITGVAEAGSTVEIKNSGNTTTLGTATANASTGAYSITLTTALINSETVNVTAKDAAGNISVVKAIVAPDKTAPSQPTAAFDTAGKVITGVAEAGSTVEVKNSGNTTTLGTATANANASTGAYTITLTTALINKETVNVTAKDTAGNVSTVKAIIAPDKTAPSQPTAAFDTTGKIITGVAEAGSTVEVKNSGNTATLGTATANASTGAYSITLTTALINKETVNVTAKDAAGNTSTAKAIIAPDKTAPSQPTAAFDTAGKVITGVAEAGSTVEIKNSGNTSTLGTATANASTGTYTITLTTALINKETVNVTAKDTAGNVSVVKAIVAPDKTPPAQPTAAFDTAGKVISGVAEAGSTVTVKNSTNTTTLGTATANATTGAYSITLTTALVNKETVNVTAKDAAGNVSAVKAIVAPLKAAINPPPLVAQALVNSTYQVDSMIQAMASFAPPSASESKVLVGVYDLTQPMLVSQSS